MGHVLLTKAPGIFHARVLDVALLVWDFAESGDSWRARRLPYPHHGSISGYECMPSLPCGLLQECPDSPMEGPCPIHDPPPWDGDSDEDAYA